MQKVKKVTSWRNVTNCGDSYADKRKFFSHVRKALLFIACNRDLANRQLPYIRSAALQNKSGQSELLGFVMVVLLVSIGMLFVVGFMVVSARDDVRVDFEDKQLAINLNDALLEVSTECRNTKVKDLLKDCAQDQYLLCDSLTSCQYLEDVVIPDVFNVTLDAWGKSYTYEAYVVQGESELMLIQHGDFATCRQAAVTPGVFYLPLRSGKTIFSELRLCRG